jgi:hypothetical protein
MQSEQRFLWANDLVRSDFATSVPADTKKKPRSKVLSGRGSSRKYQAGYQKLTPKRLGAVHGTTMTI